MSTLEGRGRWFVCAHQTLHGKFIKWLEGKIYNKLSSSLRGWTRNKKIITSIDNVSRVAIKPRRNGTKSKDKQREASILPAGETSKNSADIMS
jgi:hypothetical protein